MENIWLVALLAIIGWQVIAMRRDSSANTFATTLFLTIDSEETDQSDVPLESFNLCRKANIPFAVVPGMEWAEPGEAVSFKVVRVVFENGARMVHLKAKRVSSSMLERTVDSYVKGGWQYGSSQASRPDPNCPVAIIP